MTRAYIVSACRSPVAPRGGALAHLSLPELAAPVLSAALSRAGLDPAQVDEVICSTALGPGGNPARSIALAAGLPEQVAGLSIDRQCAGGLDALALARQMVLSGAADIVVAGGAESYSRQPLRYRTFADGRPAEAYTQAPFTPWPERDPDMAEAAAALGRSQGISRAEQDDWAVESHAKARAQPPTEAELVPLAGVSTDAFTRRLTPALCSRAKVLSGDITAANAAVAADAAAFCIVVSERVAADLALPKVELISAATKGSIPEEPGLAPLVAIGEVFRQSGLKASGLHRAEIMEAYAVQAIACVTGAEIAPRIVNRGGGALARGHPIGASGAINAVRLWHELVARGSGTGLAAIAAAGGIGSAALMRL
ncbi:thiolase family protein [Sulfitobacter sp. KE29]|uniref:thiolase family protein n=1 Tax=unclassified Sulfitobacter TaxID=196795 RepID=UPI0007C3E542|nr:MULTISPECIES: thiolase family protein [unclassified Sulfitobacter]MBO9437903.1 thiolase family protein [Sulfitobacter sp. R18_2]KZY49021.1 acetyl-CoA acetyltransferase [Sulfitobacter sp. HI0054]MDF3418786.1 thiolase family protein [Sulfitobacter sp. Ks38]MDF3426129.1 thiolase family protein [Sulfitobacter sp. KE29]MDF3429709.1 thiolase family protein [Sulfitobacter sp. S46]